MNSFIRLRELKSIITNLLLILYAKEFTFRFGSWDANLKNDYKKKSNILDITDGLEAEAFTAELVKKINDARLEYSSIIKKIKQ